MSEKIYLQLTFVDSNEKRKSFNIPFPNPELTELEVTSAMDTVIEKNIFFPALVSKYSATVITTTREDLYN